MQNKVTGIAKKGILAKQEFRGNKFFAKQGFQISIKDNSYLVYPEV